MWPGLIGGRLGYRILRYFGGDPARDTIGGKNPYLTQNKLEILFGPHLWSHVKGKIVIDFGCGDGTDTIGIAQHGALKVIGIDIREKLLQRGREAAERAGVADYCLFATKTDEKADRILSVDGFEHYDDPDDVLRIMRRLIKKNGHILISFGPTWYHPYGSHFYGLMPWSHLVFTEKAMMRWRSDFKSDDAKQYREVEGGLNQMTIRKFRNILDRSDFRIDRLDCVPIRTARLFHNTLTKEFFTSNIRCQLSPR